jgi:hypothetical protein
LTAIQTLNKTPHPIPPQPSRNPTIRRVFTQPGSRAAVSATVCLLPVRDPKAEITNEPDHRLKQF